jgi:hypothetical protein
MVSMERNVYAMRSNHYHQPIYEAMMDIIFAIGTILMVSAITGGLTFAVLCMTRWNTPKLEYPTPPYRGGQWTPEKGFERIETMDIVSAYPDDWENPDFNHTGYTGWMDQ